MVKWGTEKNYHVKEKNAISHQENVGMSKL